MSYTIRGQMKILHKLKVDIRKFIINKCLSVLRMNCNATLPEIFLLNIFHNVVNTQ